jgi:hypothetical protein
MINFPKRHIASSVANRILNLRDELRLDKADRAAEIAGELAPGAVPAQSAMLNQSLYTPPRAGGGESVTPVVMDNLLAGRNTLGG